MSKDLFMQLLMFFMLSLSSGYYAFLAWRNPQKFREMAKKSLVLYGNSDFMNSWICSELFLWFARIGMVFAASICLFVLVMSIWGAISG